MVFFNGFIELIERSILIIDPLIVNVDPLIVQFHPLIVNVDPLIGKLVLVTNWCVLSLPATRTVKTAARASSTCPPGALLGATAS